MLLSDTIKSIKMLMAFIKEYRTGLLRSILTFIDNSLDYLYNQKPCRGPMFVGWNVLFKCNAYCAFFVDTFDSLRDHKLMDIWRSDKIKQWRS